uniref:Uncharacterized protein n=1 Tax=Candidatus Kentrum sp. FW TaxID=2126338 RepID=A0A450RYR0_9GAMM|nr:MAG: hypothetical protein BECKFW1821A_GA0114235_100612 [Candidatus Kentron sp. FW]VFJ58187.1 MAG: hypothetical protein BECKFW1821B_GA0114236_10403 [Candidatus Kentron sp. FW]
MTSELETTAIKFRKDLEHEAARCIDNHETLKVNRDKGENLIVIGDAD